MTPELSRQVGRILGKATPAPSSEQRGRVIDAMADAETWDDLPSEIKDLLSELESRTAPWSPRALEEPVQAAAGDPDYAGIEDDHTEAVAALTQEWEDESGPLVEGLTAALVAKLASRSFASVGSLTVAAAVVSGLAAVLTVPLMALAVRASLRTSEHLGVPAPKLGDAVRQRVRQTAQATAALVAHGHAAAAAREALRLSTGDGDDADAIGAAVRELLVELARAKVSGLVAHAMSTAAAKAQAEGHRAALEEAPPGTTFVADETLDRATCGPCRDVDGTAYATLADGLEDYPTSMIYRLCEGRGRCRGMVSPVLPGADGETRVLAHLPGRHEQKKHGRRYNTPGDRSSGVRTSKTATGTRTRKPAKATNAGRDAGAAKALAAAKAVRESLPKDQAGWDAMIGRRKAAVDRWREDLADQRAQLEEFQSRRAETIERMIQYGVDNNGQTRAESTRSVKAMLRKKQALAINRLDDSIKFVEDDIARKEKQIEEAEPWATERDWAYPTDGSGAGNKMPPPKLLKALADVTDVGNQAMTVIKGRFDDDPELRKQREAFAAIPRARFPRSDDPEYEGLSFQERSKKQDEDLFAFKLAALDRRKATAAIAQRENEIIREFIASSRPVGGTRHKVSVLTSAKDAEAAAGKDTKPARDDWKARLELAEDYYPTDWLKLSSEASAINVAASDRAFYLSRTNTVAMNTGDGSGSYTGGYADEIDEVNVHELGHRMERTVPGLTALEFALVRKRSTGEDGKLEPRRKLSDLFGGGGYDDHEVTYTDKWEAPYAGKTYEIRGEPPHQEAWEVFQVGTQDLFGRTTHRYGDDELQAFTLGALLTLG